MKFIVALFLVFGCAEKEFDPNDPEKSYTIAKSPYDEKNYDISITKLGEFKSRFPYSKYAIEAEVLIANAQFELGRYIDAGSSYKQFTTLHPKHAQIPFVMFRIGECYWMDAPEDIDREQDFTHKAIEEWKKLTANFPTNEYAQKAEELISKGEKRMALSEETIAAFYCKKEIWHACAYRHKDIAKRFFQFPDLAQRSLFSAATALLKLADQMADLKKDHDLLTLSHTPEELRLEAKKLKEMAEAMPTH